MLFTPKSLYIVQPKVSLRSKRHLGWRQNESNTEGVPQTDGEARQRDAAWRISSAKFVTQNDKSSKDSERLSKPTQPQLVLQAHSEPAGTATFTNNPRPIIRISFHKA
jgi:hypothetical protein